LHSASCASAHLDAGKGHDAQQTPPHCRIYGISWPPPAAP
jgi:hypothetical protein